MCGSENSIMVNPQDYEKRQQGGLIQDVMPYLSPSERELLISGVCGDCYDRLFK